MRQTPGNKAGRLLPPGESDVKSASVACADGGFLFGRET